MSAGVVILEHMFDSGLRSASEAAIVTAIEDLAREEARAAARRVAAISELVRRRCGDDERAYWACDPWDATAAEIGAALGISRGRASGDMHLGLSLRYRLPRVAELFMEGLLSYRVCAAIASRTDLIQDKTALDLIDSAIAEHALSWGVLSAYKLDKAIDAWVDRYDPGALHHTRTRAQDRAIHVGSQYDGSGITGISGRLYATDAAVLDRRLMQMAHGVCDEDPRTIAQRRADALGALAAGSDRLACTCGSPACPASGDDGRAASVVVYVVTDADVENIAPDPAMSGEGFESDDPPPAKKAAATLTGRGGIVPTPLVAELIRGGAKVRHVRRPADEPEPGYRPSAALEEFVRFRDLTCRFPNCDVPAEMCDVDHTIPWPLGPTHPSNLKCACRKDHLLKTFWEGWSDRQFPDGTVEWTAPTGKTYVTHPGSRVLFPQWNITTGTLPPPQQMDPSRARTLMMPTRRRTRAEDRAYRIQCARTLNDAHVAELNRPPPF
jgi:hypothetical protein